MNYFFNHSHKASYSSSSGGSYSRLEVVGHRYRLKVHCSTACWNCKVTRLRVRTCNSGKLGALETLGTLEAEVQVRCIYLQ